MEKILNLFIVVTISLLLSSCSDSPFFNPFKGNSNLNTVRVPENFTWSLSSKVDLEIIMDLDGEAVENIEGEWVFLLDTLQNILTRGVIHNQETQLYYKIPANLGRMFVYFPTTGNYETIYSWACLGTLQFNYAWENPDVENDLQYLELNSSEDLGNNMKSGYSMKASVFGNSDFSVNSLTSVESYTSNNNVNGQWYVTTKNKAPASIENETLVLGQQEKKKVEVFQTVSWTEEGDFEVRAQVASSNNKDFKVKLYLLFYTKDGHRLRQETKSFNIKKSDAWKQIEISKEVPKNTSYIKFMIQDDGKSKESFFVDNILGYATRFCGGITHK